MGATSSLVVFRDWVAVSTFSLGSTSTAPCTYAGIVYANPHALTQLSNGYSTTTFAYDNNGNVTQKTTDGVSTTYEWDYANRLTALGVGGATTTYGYDAFGSRVLQTGTSTTTIYPFKWYSVASSTGGGARYATTTEYVFTGDTLVSTVDQQLAAGAATGTPQTLYIHPDHLGSTNVVTNASGTVAQTLDYYPYGATRINSGTDSSVHKYIGQFADQSNLSYLQARYYDPSRGQFLSQDPVFLGEPRAQNLMNPQSLNSYSYANGNPITLKDPTGQSALSDLLSQLASALSKLLSYLGGVSGGGGSGANTQPNTQNAPQSTAQRAGYGGGGVSPSNTLRFVPQTTPTGCFDACTQMAGYLPDPANRINTTTFVNGALTPQQGAQQGIQTIDSYLASGKTPIVGVNTNGGTEPLNANTATQHFVVIVGSGSDGGGKYYNFYDPGTQSVSKGTSPNNKLHVNGDTLSGKSVYNQDVKTYVVTEVRPQ